jgi:hypothetical protein
MKTFRYEASGFERVEDVHPLAHMKIFGKGKEVSCEGISMAPSAEILRKTLIYTLGLISPWVVIWKV